MSSSNLRKFTNPGFIRSLRFPNLIKLLHKFDGYFSGVVHFEYDGVEQDNFDFDRLASILVDQMMVGEYEELFNAFALIGAMSAESRGDILQQYVDAQPYRDEVSDDMSAADLAVLVYLHNPEALNDIDTQFNATRKKSFAVRVTKVDISVEEITRQQLAMLEVELNSVFVSKHRGKTAKVYPPSREGDEYWFVVRHGDCFKRLGAVTRGKESKTLAFQPESFDLVSLNTKSGELRICVPSDPQWLEECYAEAFGKALLNDYGAFSDRRDNDIDRIKDLGERILYQSYSSEIRRLDLIGLRFFSSENSRMIVTLSASAGNLFLDLKTEGYSLPDMGAILEAKFVIKIGNKEKIISLKNNNRSGYDWDEFGVVIEDWLRSSGIIPTQKKKVKAA